MVAQENIIIENVTLAIGATKLKYKDRNDLLLMLLPPATTVAGVFTKSNCPSAPVEYCREILHHGQARALIVNAGNANAFTGQAGRNTVSHIVNAISQLLHCNSKEVFIASTGVIGEPLDADSISKLLPKLLQTAKVDNWYEAAKAIMTTDRTSKAICRTFNYEGIDISIAAIAKGAGMIAPDMATMLCFIATDADIKSEILQTLLQKAVDNSFNNITIDSDTSTSDTVLLFATGSASNNKVAAVDDPLAQMFCDELTMLCKDLALQIVMDGEGASHLIKIEICGAINDASAKKIGFSIANSPLVKTAIAGNDANWGRVIMAIGKAGEPADRDKLMINFGPYCVACDGARSPHYNEAALTEYMKNYQIDIKVDMGLGQGSAEIYTCDLTSEYISINADYRS